MSCIADSPPSADYLPGVNVPAVPLGEVLHKQIPNQSVQLMNIDIEGAEMDALSSNDWAVYSPEVIIIECKGFDMMNPKAAETISFLFDKGYRVDGKMGENVILIR